VTTSPDDAEVVQFSTRFAAVDVGTGGKYCVKVTKAATLAIAAIAITPRMTTLVRLNLDFDFCLFSNFSLPLPHWGEDRPGRLVWIKSVAYDVLQTSECSGKRQVDCVYLQHQAKFASLSAWE
jgi:hypothetical protein